MTPPFVLPSSIDVRDALNDEALQELICRIDGSSNAENVIVFSLFFFSHHSLCSFIIVIYDFFTLGKKPITPPFSY